MQVITVDIPQDVLDELARLFPNETIQEIAVRVIRENVEKRLLEMQSKPSDTHP